MAIDRTRLLTDLGAATRVAAAAATGKISIPSFVEQYKNFYYAAALDGHEDEPDLVEVIRSIPELVRFHEQVQREVVNATYIGPAQSPETLTTAGRISIEEAQARLRRIASESQLTKLLESLPY